MLKNRGTKKFSSVMTVILSLCAISSVTPPAAMAASGTITGVNQKPWIIKEGDHLKSETALTGLRR